MRGQRHIFGGRTDVRRVLYGRLGLHALQSGAQGLLARLLVAGKPKKVALVACMHKLPVIINAIARSKMPWSGEIAKVV